MARMFDPKCHDLAAYFLLGEPDVHDTEIGALAQELQDAIEDFLNNREKAANSV